MDQFFGGLRKLFQTGKTVIDNYVFQLHYRLTVIILIAFSLLVTGRQYFGDPIDCISKDDIPSDLLDTFCWIHTTFSVPSAWHKEVGEEVPYPGVDKFVKGEKKVHHAYYQWVCFVLFLQAILFYLPRYFWKAMEGDRVKSLVMDLKSPIFKPDSKEESRTLLIDYLLRNKGNHKLYYCCYCLAEFMNFLNVVGQMFLMNRFLGGEFSSYGHLVLQFTEWDWTARYDPMIKVFPRLSKCTFHRFGSSGNVQRHDAMCILPINIVNEKIYVFLWFWFVILAVVTGLTLVYRGVVFFSAKTRYRILQVRSSNAENDALQTVVDKSAVGDWYVLYLLSKNINGHHFKYAIEEYAKHLEGRAKISQ
ncbi:innexin inx2-like [Centruroides sculpturatus]|uniref:innexin inx2-like n=1 Tax=Centruroides sculpturatus TaxID=218467 RepID=UPI000C6EC6C4|nr:innexin inx2-like [Centruroides sculpturatus]